MDKDLLKMNLQLFAEGEPEPTGENGDDSTDGEKTSEQTFTQADLNRIGKVESEKGYNKALRELGVESLDDVKALIEAEDKRKQDEMTELDKINAQLAEKDALFAEKEAEYNKLVQTNTALINGVIGDKVADAVTLANARVTDELSFDDALKAVIAEYPNFTGEEVKEAPKKWSQGGTNTAGKSTTDPFEAIKNRYK